MADAPALADAWADPEIARWNGVPDPLPRHERLDRARRWIERAPDRWAAAGVVDLVIPDPVAGNPDPVAGGAVAGEVGLRNRTTDPDRAELGVWLLPAGRGRSLAASAVPTITAWAFAELGLVQVWARAHVANDRALRLFERLGWDRLGERAGIVVLACTPAVLR